MAHVVVGRGLKIKVGTMLRLRPNIVYDTYHSSGWLLHWLVFQQLVKVRVGDFWKLVLHLVIAVLIRVGWFATFQFFFVQHLKKVFKLFCSLVTPTRKLNIFRQKLLVPRCDGRTHYRSDNIASIARINIYRYVWFVSLHKLTLSVNQNSVFTSNLWVLSVVLWRKILGITLCLLRICYIKCQKLVFYYTFIECGFHNFSV